MNIFAAVMTANTPGPIAVIGLFGPGAARKLGEIFTPASGKEAVFEVGNILLGTILNGDKAIDQVIIGCEGENYFAINCHGNPLIVSEIMTLLGEKGVGLITAEDMLARIAVVEKLDAISIEARIALPKAKTLAGTKIIANQAGAGLAGWAKKRLSGINIEEIRTESEHILRAGETAKLIIDGCSAVLIGPANSGKSTLLNCLAGREKAIVTDIKGTTRDHVTATCQIGSILVELIDTAGLSEELITESAVIEKMSQARSAQLLEKADLVLLVLDNSRSQDQLDKGLIEKLRGKKIVTILNKSDLSARLKTGKLPDFLNKNMQISAKFDKHFKKLTKTVTKMLGISEFKLDSTVCFTSRQRNLLEQLSHTKSETDAASLIEQLLNGNLNV